MSEIRTKRWDEPAEPADGTRILICRYRPRGVAKSAETWTEWLPDLGPSRALHAAAYGKGGGSPLAWPLYRANYLKEMREQSPNIERLARRIAAGETITLLCSSACLRESRCHRSLLARLVKEKIDPQISTDEHR